MRLVCDSPGAIDLFHAFDAPDVNKGVRKKYDLFIRFSRTASGGAVSVARKDRMGWLFPFCPNSAVFVARGRDSNLSQLARLNYVIRFVCIIERQRQLLG